MEIKISSGYIVKFKSFVNRKTAREYRQTLLKNAKTKEVLNEKTLKPEQKVDYAMEQFDLANDVLVRGVISEIASPDGGTVPEATLETFLENMADDDFNMLLKEANLIFYPKLEEKKSS